MEEVDNMML